MDFGVTPEPNLSKRRFRNTNSASMITMNDTPHEAAITAIAGPLRCLGEPALLSWPDWVLELSVPPPDFDVWSEGLDMASPLLPVLSPSSPPPYSPFGPLGVAFTCSPSGFVAGTVCSAIDDDDVLVDRNNGIVVVGGVFEADILARLGFAVLDGISWGRGLDFTGGTSLPSSYIMLSRDRYILGPARWFVPVTV